MRPQEGGLRGGGILALPYYSHHRLCASMGGLRRVRSVCLALSAFSFIMHCSAETAQSGWLAQCYDTVSNNAVTVSV